MRIVLTGSSGFVGTNLQKHFAENGQAEVITLDARRPLNMEMLSGEGTLIHLAGKAHDLKSPDNEEEYFEANTHLTMNLFDLFLQSSLSDFIYFSSVKAVADSVDRHLEESHPADPKTAYGRSKQQAEAYILSKTLPEGKRLIVIRPCMIHGPGNKGNLNLLHKVVNAGLPYPLAAYNNLRSFLSIDNLNYIIERFVADQAIPGGVYHAADDEPLSTNEIIQMMSEVADRKVRLWKVSPHLIRMVASLGDKLHLPLNSERLRKLTENYVVSNEKLKTALHIEALPVTSRNGLEKTIRSFNVR